MKAFLGDRALTTSRLAAELDGVPASSIHGHVARLANAGVLQVVAERRVRGVVERTYTLRAAAAQVGPGEIAAMSPEEHMAAFTAYKNRRRRMIYAIFLHAPEQPTGRNRGSS